MLTTAPTVLASHQVLVVEDDEDFRFLVANALRERGHDVLEAPNGGFALRSWFGSDSSAMPDVIVSDLRMPGLSGLGLLTLLRGEEWHGLFVLITAFPEDSTYERAKELGAVVVAKPVDIMALADMVDRCVRIGS
ncbi:MAG: response regulator [Polyangiaceae bacterium]|nr:response regulator [Polyangiaceae bacterium]